MSDALSSICCLNLPALDSIKRFVAENWPLARALDEFSQALRNRVDDVLKLKLWDHIRDGRLHVQVERTVTNVRKDGTSVSKHMAERVPYASIQGHQVLDPIRSTVSRKLATIEKHLAAIGDWNMATRRLHTLDSRERQQLSSSFKGALRLAAEVDKQIEQELKLTARVTTDTLNTWSNRMDCPLPFAFEVVDHDLFVGRDANHKIRLSFAPVVSAHHSRLDVNLRD